MENKPNRMTAMMLKRKDGTSERTVADAGLDDALKELGRMKGPSVQFGPRISEAVYKRLRRYAFETDGRENISTVTEKALIAYLDANDG